MKIAIMGAGGLGALYGGLLARAGERVHFIARRAHLAALRERGLSVQSAPLGDFHLPQVMATEDPAEIGPVDVVLMGVKAYDLPAASAAIRPLLGPQTYVVPLLNGVDIAERIEAALNAGADPPAEARSGGGRVLGGVCFASSNIIAPGQLRHVFDGPLLFGALDGRPDTRAEALETALRKAGANARQSPDIRVDLWRKFVMVAALAGASSATRLATRALVADPDTRSVFVEAMGEVAALAQARGVTLDADVVARHLAFADGVNPQHTASMLLDLRDGRRLELDIFQRTILRLAAEAGVSTPVNRLLYAVLKPHEHGAPA